MRHAEQAAAEEYRASATSAFTWPPVVAGLAVAGAGMLAGVLGPGPTLRQVTLGVLVAALAAAALFVPWLRTRHEVHRLRRLERAPEGVVVTAAATTGRPAALPDDTPGGEATRLLALPVMSADRPVGAVVERTADASERDVEAARQLLARIAPALTGVSPVGPAASAAPGPSAPAASSASAAPRVPKEEDGRSADAELRELVARAAHDLRTPLNTLTGMVDTLVRHGEQLPPEQRTELEAALQRSTRRVAEWVTALLDAAVGKGSRPDRAEPFPLHPLLEEAMAVSRAATAGLDVRIGPTDLRVVADPGDVVRVVGNLLTNAGHHAHEGGSVEVEARPRGDEVEVWIRDHGSGWDRDVTAARNGREGRRVHHAGLGLGLESVRAQVEDWGGQLEFDDTPGGGATVRFTLPRAPGADAPTDDVRGQGWTIAGSASHVRGTERTAGADNGDQLPSSGRSSNDG